MTTRATLFALVALSLVQPEASAPQVPDSRPGPRALALPGALEALAMADAQVLAVVAKAEDADAAVAVMWTVLNRARLAGTTPLAVATSGAYGTWRAGARHESWTWNSERRWPHPLDQAQLRRLEALALQVLAGAVPDPTGGATHFHRAGTWVPPWAPEPSAWVLQGQHHFYTEHRGA